MIIGTGEVYLQANWVHSLKEKRMIVQSLIKRVQNKFNVSIAEVDNQDKHQIVTFGIACVSNSTSHANEVIQHVINFIESNTDAVLIDFNIEII
ncbi:DUF503 domain-containing protein [Clostridium peptidivorans]|uniref:DUF503 domain-containing protein n=1 Tax=Clostridium peptidivorans TaxID=100174 RepID=UPI000BE2510D|nr:DUF503 domain-containing protein [Clostridium peptidivorans]